MAPMVPTCSFVPVSRAVCCVASEIRVESVTPDARRAPLDALQLRQRNRDQSKNGRPQAAVLLAGSAADGRLDVLHGLRDPCRTIGRDLAVPREILDLSREVRQDVARKTRMTVEYQAQDRRKLVCEGRRLRRARE